MEAGKYDKKKERRGNEVSPVQRSEAIRYGTSEIGNIITLKTGGGKINFLFSKLHKSQRLHIQVDTEALYSITDQKSADKTTTILSNLPKISPESVITDATACVGGNTISFADTFHKVMAVEIDKGRYEMLKHNVHVTGNTERIKYFHGNALSFMESGPLKGQDIFFMDPPWGGPDYKEYTDLDLELSGVPLAEVCERVKEKTKYVAIKVPMNFGFEKFQRAVTARHIATYKNLRKMVILVLDYNGGLEESYTVESSSTETTPPPSEGRGASSAEPESEIHSWRNRESLGKSVQSSGSEAKKKLILNGADRSPLQHEKQSSSEWKRSVSTGNNTPVSEASPKNTVEQRFKELAIFELNEGSQESLQENDNAGPSSKKSLQMDCADKRAIPQSVSPQAHEHHSTQSLHPSQQQTQSSRSHPMQNGNMQRHLQEPTAQTSQPSNSQLLESTPRPHPQNNQNQTVQQTYSPKEQLLNHQPVSFSTPEGNSNSQLAESALLHMSPDPQRCRTQEQQNLHQDQQGPLQQLRTQQQIQQQPLLPQHMQVPTHSIQASQNHIQPRSQGQQSSQINVQSTQAYHYQQQHSKQSNIQQHRTYSNQPQHPSPRPPRPGHDHFPPHYASPSHQDNLQSRSQSLGHFPQQDKITTPQNQLPFSRQMQNQGNLQSYAQQNTSQQPLGHTQRDHVQESAPPPQPQQQIKSQLPQAQYGQFQDRRSGQPQTGRTEIHPNFPGQSLQNITFQQLQHQISQPQPQPQNTVPLQQQDLPSKSLQKQNSQPPPHPSAQHHSQVSQPLQPPAQQEVNSQRFTGHLSQNNNVQSPPQVTSQYQQQRGDPLAGDHSSQQSHAHFELQQQGSPQPSDQRAQQNNTQPLAHPHSQWPQRGGPQLKDQPSQQNNFQASAQVPPQRSQVASPPSHVHLQRHQRGPPQPPRPSRPAANTSQFGAQQTPAQAPPQWSQGAGPPSKDHSSQQSKLCTPAQVHSQRYQGGAPRPQGPSQPTANTSQFGFQQTPGQGSPQWSQGAGPPSKDHPSQQSKLCTPTQVHSQRHPGGAPRPPGPSWPAASPSQFGGQQDKQLRSKTSPSGRLLQTAINDISPSKDLKKQAPDQTTPPGMHQQQEAVPRRQNSGGPKMFSNAINGISPQKNMKSQASDKAPYPETPHQNQETSKRRNSGGSKMFNDAINSITPPDQRQAKNSQKSCMDVSQYPKGVGLGSRYSDKKDTYMADDQSNEPTSVIIMSKKKKEPSSQPEMATGGLGRLKIKKSAEESVSDTSNSGYADTYVYVPDVANQEALRYGTAKFNGRGEYEIDSNCSREQQEESTG